MALIQRQAPVARVGAGDGVPELQQIVQVPIADRDAVVAAAMLASYGRQLLAVEPGQENASFAVTHEATLWQGHRGTGCGADTQNGQLRPELLGMAGQHLPLRAIQAAGQQQYP